MNDLPDEVRFNKSKSPVYWAFMDQLYRVQPLSIWMRLTMEGNSDMDFVDFGLLAADIMKFRAGSADVDGQVLFRALVYFKAINDFTINYHKAV